MSMAEGRVLHLHSLTASGADIIFILAIDPLHNAPNSYAISLYSKSGRVERRIGHPLQLKLSFDPKDAEFEVCLSPKNSFPRNALFGLRVWLRVSAISPETGQFTTFRHRLFSEESFWISRTPDFRMKWEGSQIAIPIDIKEKRHVHSTVLTGVPLLFVAKLSNVDTENADSAEFLISLEYELGGVTRTLCRNIDARITCPLSDISFTIYTIPSRPTTTGSMHRLFFWMRSTTLTPAPSSFNSSTPHQLAGVCQRLWKTDSFHITGLTLPLDLASDETIFARPDPRSPMVIEVDENGKSTGNVISAERRPDPGIRRLSKDTSTTTSSSTTVSPSSPIPAQTANAFYGNWQTSAASSSAIAPSSLVVRNAQPSDSLPPQSLGPPLNPYHGRSFASPAFSTAVPASSSTANPFSSPDDVSESVYDAYGGIASTSAQHLPTEKRVTRNSPPLANRDFSGDISDRLGAVMLATEGIEEEAAPSYDAVTGGHSGAFPEEKAEPRR